MDFNRPNVANATTDDIADLKQGRLDAARGFDPAVIESDPSNKPEGMIRWNGALKKFQKLVSSVWGDLTDLYAISISGNAASATTVADAAITPAKMSNAGAEYSGWNRLINGDFSIKQYTSSSASNDQYCFDRWYLLIQSGSLDAISTGINAEAGQPTSANFSFSLPGVGPNKRFGVAQIVESINSRDLRSKAATLSARIRINDGTGIGLRCAILEWTGTADSVTSDVVNNWSSTNYTPGNFFISGVNVIAMSAITPSASTWTDISCTGTFGASTNNIIVFFWMDAVTNSGSLQLGLAQLEQGATKTPFKRQSVDLTFRQCQRYAELMSVGLQGSAVSTTVAALRDRFAVDKRIPPTSVTVLNASPTLRVASSASIGAIAGTWGASPSAATTNGFEVTFTRTSGAWAVGNEVAVIDNNVILLTCEL